MAERETTASLHKLISWMSPMDMNTVFFDEKHEVIFTVGVVGLQEAQLS